MAYDANGGGMASSEPLTEVNPTFNFGANNDWNNKARYFAYLNAVGSFPYVCVFPQLNLGGTPLVIPLGQARAQSAAFGQSNAFPDMPACSRFAP
jgi:hypothetical protein